MPQIINIERIILDWSEWYTFNHILANIGLIPNVSGVYEVIEPGKECRLTIGESCELRRRIRTQLIKGSSHSAGEDIKQNFEPAEHSNLLVRWALTNRRACVQEELHRLYQQKHHCMPRFTDRT